MVSLQGSLLGTQAGPGWVVQPPLSAAAISREQQSGADAGRPQGATQGLGLGRSQLGLGATWLLLCSPFRILVMWTGLALEIYCTVLEEAWG